MAVIRSQIISGNPDHTVVPAKAPAQTSPGGPPHSVDPSLFVGGNAYDKLIVRDRHVVLTTGTERGGGRLSGDHDAVLDGPARPSMLAINRTVNYQQGTDSTRNLDDRNRPYAVDSAGKWVGQQDGSVQSVYGGTPGLWQPYGSYAGYTTGPTKGIQSNVTVGSAQDGPQKIRSGVPHGLHTATFPNSAQSIGRYMDTPQMIAGVPSRPFNSPIAGQSYSQTIAPLGQTGTVQVGTTSTAQSRGRSVGYNPGAGWRGM